MRDKVDWLELWMQDKQSIMNCMVENLAADLAAGYDPFGKSVTQQRRMITDYNNQYDLQMKALGVMEPRKVQHWCYMDLKRRGAIA